MNYNNIMNGKSFWERVKPLIKTHNMTQNQFADHLGFSRHTVRGWIYNNRIPELSAAYAIAFAKLTTNQIP